MAYSQTIEINAVILTLFIRVSMYHLFARSLWVLMDMLGLKSQMEEQLLWQYGLDARPYFILISAQDYSFMK